MAEPTLDCIFCKIVAGEIDAKVVAQNSHAVVFQDLNPQAPTHLLAIPRQHIASLDTVLEDQWEAVHQTLALAQQTAREKDLSQNGYRVVNNIGKDGGQTVFHLHFHILGGRQMTWPPG